MKVAVIILNWNGKKLMEKFLPSLLKHTPCETAEIIVADNCSTDGSVKMLQERFPSVRVIVLDRNYGFAEGYNRAIEQVDSDYTVLLNSDVEVTPHWLDAPLDAMDRDTRIAGVQPKILSERNRSFFEYAGASGGWIDRYGYPFCRGRVLGVVEEDQGQYDTTADVFWASGACLFVRTDVYKKEGGLDSRFFCSSGRNRPVLAIALTRIPAVMHPPVGCLSRRRRYAACRESAQNVPELPQQPADDL